jgi:hypothetical protein
VTPPPSDAPASHGGSTNRTIGYVGLVVGGVGIVTGTVAGILAIGKHSDVGNSPCATGPCSATDASSYLSARDSYHTVATVSTVGFILGGVAAATGVVFLYVLPSHHDETTGVTIQPAIGLGTLGALGTF